MTIETDVRQQAGACGKCRWCQGQMRTRGAKPGVAWARNRRRHRFPPLWESMPCSLEEACKKPRASMPIQGIDAHTSLRASMPYVGIDALPFFKRAIISLFRPKLASVFSFCSRKQNQREQKLSRPKRKESREEKKEKEEGNFKSVILFY